MNCRNTRVGREHTGLLTGLCLAVASLILSLTVMEIVLREIGVDHLPTVWANELGTGYVVAGDGIYRFDPALNMVRMRPHYDRMMFFNGYHWLHHADWMGFRNPTDRKRVDIALIGDSMIYGHGLEESETVSSHLERLLNRPVANLGIQSAAMDYEYEILKHDASRLDPRYVFVFFLNNDITDVESRLSQREMRRFLELPVQDHTDRYFDLKHGMSRSQRNFSLRNLYVVRSFVMLRHFLRRWASEHSKTKTRDAGATLPDEPAWMTQPPFAGDPRMQLAMFFHLRAISKANDFASRHGMRMVYVFIAVPLPYDRLYEQSIGDYCRANGIDFFSLRAALDSARKAGLRVYLPGDGHFSSEGAEVTAEALADHYHLRDETAWR
jgi:SGNH hydrolase-like domain, acetyltransferase AlgX